MLVEKEGLVIRKIDMNSHNQCLAWALLLHTNIGPRKVIVAHQQYRILESTEGGCFYDKEPKCFARCEAYLL